MDKNPCEDLQNEFFRITDSLRDRIKRLEIERDKYRDALKWIREGSHVWMPEGTLKDPIEIAKRALKGGGE